VVIEAVPPAKVVGGVPARVIKQVGAQPGEMRRLRASK